MNCPRCGFTVRPFDPAQLPRVVLEEERERLRCEIGRLPSTVDLVFVARRHALLEANGAHSSEEFRNAALRVQARREELIAQCTAIDRALEALPS